MLDKSKPYAEASIVRKILQHANKFSGETFVFSCSRSIIESNMLISSFTKDIVILRQSGINPIVVHEGSTKVNSVLRSMDISLNFLNDSGGISNSGAMEAIEMVLSGLINKQIVQKIGDAGGNAIGLSGRDSHLIEASRLKTVRTDKDRNIRRIMNFGFTGKVVNIDPTVLTAMEESGFIPVIAPIGVDSEGQSYNMNADDVAGAIAVSLAAAKLILLSDSLGVLDQENNLIPRLSVEEAKNYIKRGIIKGNIASKVSVCIKTVETGIGVAHIINDTIPGALLLGIFTDYLGTGSIIVNN